MSDDVCTLTARVPAVTAPIRNPDMVKTKAVFGMGAPDVVMTMEVAPVGPHEPVSAATLLVPAAMAVGTMADAKNPDG